jgi:uncharacterized protein (TIGR03118 family)
MARNSSWLTRSAIAALGLATFGVACGDDTGVTAIIPIVTPLNVFLQTNLVSDAAGAGAVTVDPQLVNPWGLAFDPSGALWVANNGTGTATTYGAAGNKLPTTVTIPSGGLGGTGTPTGLVLNTTTDFAIPNSTAATYIFAGEDGSISAWNAAAGAVAVVVANRGLVATPTGATPGPAAYKGIAIASTGGANFLYAADFHNGQVDVFDKNFVFVKSFTDATIPAGFAPFNIANIGGLLYVTYAKQLGPDNHDDAAGVGNGFVDVFNADGTMVRRFASNGRLNSPWAVTAAPATFGPFAGAILIGNFGDGTIGVYDASTGAFIDVLRNASASPIVITGLWGLAFGPGAGSNILYFSSGPGDEAHGLVGTLSPQ